MISRLTDIIREASRLMLTDTFQISQKEGFANIVTSSDLAVQEFLKRELAALLPGSGFLCEEEDRHTLDHEYTLPSTVRPITAVALTSVPSAWD